MATRFSSALVCMSDTDAHFQAWAQFVEDTLVTTGGWVVTSDTGQTLPSALIHTTTANVKVGYRIYRMNDSLQATYPVFMRIDYGSGSGAGNYPGMWITIGTGSNGSGTITGILYNGGASASAIVQPNSSSSVTATNSYGSADTGRFSICLFVCATNTLVVPFGLERTKSSTGSDTGDGLLFACRGGGALGFNASQYLIYAGGTQPATEVGLNYILTQNNPSQTFTPGDIGVGILIHMKGTAQQPGLNWFFTNSSDVSAESFITLNIYGVSHTYQHCNSLVAIKRLTASSITDSARVLMRYE